jgi:acetyl-CoA synthetase
VAWAGVLVELLRDAATLLLPVSLEDIRGALRSLRGWPLLSGYLGRLPGPATWAGYLGRTPGDVDAAVDAVATIARYAEAHADRPLELDINPLLVLPQGRGVVAADALIRLGQVCRLR